jgi:hypothetical protein
MLANGFAYLGRTVEGAHRRLPRNASVTRASRSPTHLLALIPDLQESAAEVIGSVINPSRDELAVSEDHEDGSLSSPAGFRDVEDRSTGLSPS